MITFDPTGPLPQGTTVLEASAGTGKTYAIAALATRYLAEGMVTPAELTVISFSRIASGELRNRVRQRLQQSIEQLTAHQAGTLKGELEATDALLAAAETEVVARRIMRLRRAAASLDEASIMTIHQFCQAMLVELGVLAEQDLQAELVEDFTSLLDEAICDLYLARYAKLEIEPPFKLAEARQLGQDAVERPDARLVPAGLGGHRGERIRFAEAVRAEFARRKRQQGIFSFDDQLQRLLAALSGPGAPAGLARLRRRCRVVLVDEFQDTDPVQWQILRAAFHQEVPLVLIGDPKQSIYAFRGADVTTYTAAVAEADQRYSLDLNWRADSAVVDAVGALFHNALLGEDIGVPPVRATHLESRLKAAGTPWESPAQLRCLAGTELWRAGDARAEIIADLVGQVVSLLSSSAQLVTECGERALRARDIAVLVSTNQRGRQIGDALIAAGVPVAFSGADSIFATPAAGDWLTLLRALDDPRRNTIRAAVLTDFVGADLTALATAPDDQLTAWAALLQTWTRILNSHCVAALFAAIQAGAEGQDGLAERLLARAGGERDLTDFRHLAELLHAQHARGVRGPALVSWLTAEIANASASSDRIRRLETDRSAVRVMTVHKAKGLQFPVVLLPEAADLWVPDDDSDRALTFHLDGERVVDLGGTSAPGRAERFERYCAEEAADRLRALYVAATRAESQLTMWWAPTMATTAAAPLHRLLFRSRETPATPDPAYPLEVSGHDHPRQLSWLAPAGIQVNDFDPTTAPRLPRVTSAPPQLRLAGFDRSVDHTWRRTSYSGLTEAAHAHAPLGATAPLLADEPSETPLAAGGQSLTTTASPMADLPGGTGFGSLVHHILENLDWYAPTPDSIEALSGRLLAETTASSKHFGLRQVDPQELATALLPSLLTPLGRLTDGRPLAAIEVCDRLSELNFEFALGDAHSMPNLGQVAELMASWLPTDDPLVGYPAELAHLGDQLLHGFLTGSIDSVFRIPGTEGPRFVVVDYKTNRLGPAELTLAHYERAPMVTEMLRTHYPLQAILYCVALHRFLTDRMANYQAEKHLGGVGYLFVRGMGGPQARPAPDGTITGVFDWYPPAGLVVELSDLLAGGRLS